jgi:transposase
LPDTKSPDIEPLRVVIKEMFTAGLSGQRIYQDLVEDGYAGGYDAVKRYVRKLRRTVAPYPFKALPTLPGEEAQVDFAKGALVFHNGKNCWAWVFKMTLSYSGYSYEELVFSQDVETFLRCHEHAFEHFGGVPTMIKLDNLKSGVLSASFYDPILNPQYKAFSEHWGFVPHPCEPYKPRHKGRVERDVAYTKNNALKGKIFRSLEEGNNHLKCWNKRWAGTRIHGSKKKQVFSLFIEHEKSKLKPLAQKPFTLFKLGSRKVDYYGRIEICGNYYPIPEAHIGQRVVVHFNSEIIKVFFMDRLIKLLRPVSGKGHINGAVPGDRPQRPAFLEEVEGRLGNEAKAAGTYCHKVMLNILAKEDDPIAIRRARGLSSLIKKYESGVVDFACQWGLEQNRTYYGAIKEACERILSSGAPDELPIKLRQEHELIRTPDTYTSIINERSLYGKNHV